MDISARALLVNTTVRVWTGEKRDRVGDLLRLADAAQRDVFGVPPLDLF